MNYLAAIGISIGLLATSCTSPDHPLLGTWTLHRIESQDSLHQWQQADWMKNGTGRLCYYDNDTVTVHFTPEHYGDEGVEAYWYIASYKVHPDSGFVQHTRVRHSDPDEIGKTVTRYFEVHNDTLRMFAKEFGFRLTWIKQHEPS